LKKRDDDEYGIWEQGPYDEHGICLTEPFGADQYGAYVQYVQYKATLPTKKLIVDPHHIPYSCTYLVEHSTFWSTVLHKYLKFQTSKSSSNLNFKQFPIRLLCFLTII
jgi:hypothetical protein